MKSKMKNSTWNGSRSGCEQGEKRGSRWWEREIRNPRNWGIYRARNEGNVPAAFQSTLFKASSSSSLRGRHQREKIPEDQSSEEDRDSSSANTWRVTIGGQEWGPGRWRGQDSNILEGGKRDGFWCFDRTVEIGRRGSDGGEGCVNEDRVHRTRLCECLKPVKE